jgi:hypothetical protein
VGNNLKQEQQSFNLGGVAETFCQGIRGLARARRRFVATMGGESRRLFLRGTLSRRERVSVAINEPLSNHRDSALR